MQLHTTPEPSNRTEKHQALAEVELARNPSTDDDDEVQIIAEDESENIEPPGKKKKRPLPALIPIKPSKEQNDSSLQFNQALDSLGTEPLIIQAEEQDITKPTVPLKSSSNSLLEAFQEDDFKSFTDVRLVSEDGGACEVHSVMLALRSEQLRTLLLHNRIYSGDAVQTILLAGVSRAVLRVLVRGLYTGEMECEDERQLREVAAAMEELAKYGLFCAGDWKRDTRKNGELCTDGRSRGLVRCGRLLD